MIVDEIRSANFASHIFVDMDDCTRCMDCEIGIWSGHKEYCGAN